jgi:D-amino-acid dehydrogenase
MASGSGQLLADLVTGRQPAISTEGLALDRYSQAAPARSLLKRAVGATA